MGELKPFVCPKHPQAQIRHEWDQTHYVMNGYPSGVGIKGNHKYFCSICGLELCSEDEYKNRRAGERKEGK